MTAAVTRAGGAAAPISAPAQDTPSDEMLLERIANGDRLAMQMLYTRYQTPLYRLLLRLVRSEALAEELLNDLFLDVWRQAAPFGTKVSTWLFASAHRAAHAALRGRSAPDAGIATVGAGNAPAQDRAARMRRSLAALAAEDGEVLDLAYYHGKSLDEVAAILAIPRTAVLARMDAARGRLAALVAA